MKEKKSRTLKPKQEDPQKKRSKEILFGGFLILLSLLLFIAFTSYYLTWKIDQSTLGNLTFYFLTYKKKLYSNDGLGVYTTFYLDHLLQRHFDL